jgi:hypothetical protein
VPFERAVDFPELVEAGGVDLPDCCEGCVEQGSGVTLGEDETVVGGVLGVVGP